MTLVKITIVAWVITFAVRFFVKAGISREDLIQAALHRGKLKMTFWRWILVLLVVTSIGLTGASINRFLFFSGVI